MGGLIPGLELFITLLICEIREGGIPPSLISQIRNPTLPGEILYRYKLWVNYVESCINTKREGNYLIKM